ncbi:hypothetical protein [Pseudomonas sp.]|nr:hypothetical protein [Pseudomonas sp.]
MGLAIAGDDQLQAGAALERLDLRQAAAGCWVDEDRYRSIVLC